MRRAAVLCLSLLVLLAVPATAAAPTGVKVTDFAFTPKTVTVNQGDTVIWSFNDQTHDVTSNANQTTGFRSGDKVPGTTYSHTFSKRGSFTYYCSIHPFMKGRVNVGPAPYPDSTYPTIRGLKAKTGSGRATLGFKLSEKATVTLKLSGKARRTVKRKLGKGKRKLTLRHLKAGRYKASVTAKDQAGHKSRRVAVKRFRLR